MSVQTAAKSSKNKDFRQTFVTSPSEVLCDVTHSSVELFVECFSRKYFKRSVLLNCKLCDLKVSIVFSSRSLFTGMVWITILFCLFFQLLNSKYSHRKFMNIFKFLYIYYAKTSGCLNSLIYLIKIEFQLNRFFPN